MFVGMSSTVPMTPLGSSQVTSMACEVMFCTMRPASLSAQMVASLVVQISSGLGLTFTSKSRVLSHDVPSAQTDVWVTVPVTSNSKDSQERDKGDEALGGTLLVQTKVSAGSAFETLSRKMVKFAPSQTKLPSMPPETTRSMLPGVCTTWLISAVLLQEASSPYNA